LVHIVAPAGLEIAGSDGCAYALRICVGLVAARSMCDEDGAFSLDISVYGTGEGDLLM
jgi:hypothetical protein